MIVELGVNDLDEIMELERASFDVDMQADRQLYRRRFELGHAMLAYREEKLLGLISFSYGKFDPAVPTSIPDTFSEWSQQRVPAAFDTVFIYNLGVLPSERGRTVTKELVQAALARARQDGCKAALAECPIPSYAGNDHVRKLPAIQAALDHYAAGGAFPATDLLFRDPHLNFYRRLYNCSIAAIKPRFLPADLVSGGFRAMLWASL